MIGCRCQKGHLIGKELDVASGITKLECSGCGEKRIDIAPEREMKEIRVRTGFYESRKNWARELLKRLGLTKPGEGTEAEFEGMRYSVTIGPRLGVRIWESSRN